MYINLYFLYLENDGWAWLLLQDTSGAEGLKVRVRVVKEVGVVVDQQRLDVVEDEPKLVRVLHCVQTRMVLCNQGGSEAAHTGGVQYFTNLGRMNIDRRKKSVWGRNPLFVMLLGVALKQSRSCYDSLSTLKWNKKCDSVIQDKRRQLSPAKMFGIIFLWLQNETPTTQKFQADLL